MTVEPAGLRHLFKCGQCRGRDRLLGAGTEIGFGDLREGEGLVRGWREEERASESGKGLGWGEGASGPK